MRRVAFWAGIAIIVLVVVVLVVVQTVDWQQYTDTIAAAVKEQTGRNLEIGGPVKVAIFPPGVFINDVSLSNAPGGSRELMVKIKRIDAKLKMADLLRGKLALSLDLSEPDVLLETVESGVKNWSISLNVPKELAVARLNVANGVVVFRQYPSGAEWRLGVAQLRLQRGLTPGYSARLNASLNGLPVSLDVRAGPPDGLVSNDALAIEAQGEIAGAEFILRGKVETSGGKTVGVGVNLKASSIDLGAVLKAISGSDQLQGGRTEVAVDLQASGRSPALLVSSLQGHVRVVVGPGRLNNRDLDELIGDVFAGVLDTIDPFRSEETTSDLKCLVVNVPVRDGIVLIDHTVALETDKVGVSVAGLVNLGTEKIDLLAQPRAKEGLGLGANLLSEVVRIRGTLSEPRTEVDAAGVVRTGIFLGIDVATLGMTTLARGLISKISADQMCEEALQTRSKESAGK